MANTSSPIPLTEPIKVVAQILQDELDLKPGQIMLGFENWQISNETGLYIALMYGMEQIVGSSNNNSTDVNGNYQEVQSVSMLHQIEIDVMSFDDSARLQKEEVVMALSSFNAQQLMETNQMRVASIPASFITVTAPEPSKQLNRYRFSVSLYSLHQRVLTTPYFDSLQKVALVEQS